MADNINKSKIENLKDLRNLPVGSVITFLDEWNVEPGKKPFWVTLILATFSELPPDGGEIYFYINGETFLCGDNEILDEPVMYLVH